MTAIDIDAIEARTKAATPGKWRSESELPYARMPRVHSSEGYLIAEIGNAQVDHQDWWEADAEFIANAKQDIPALISTLRERDAEIERLREQVDALNETDALFRRDVACKDDALRDALFCLELWQRRDEPMWDGRASLVSAIGKVRAALSPNKERQS